MRTFFCSLIVFVFLTVSLKTLGLSREDSLSKYEKLDSSEILAASFCYKTGEQELGNGAVLQVPKGYRLLDGVQGRLLVEHLWGNPENPDILGVLLADRMGPMEKDFRGVVISFEASGYMAETEIRTINYTKLLGEMKEQLKNDNLLRRRKGAGVISGMDWAFTPYYNKDNHSLHWARLLHFGKASSSILNYEVRLLGRRGVLCFTAIGKAAELDQIRQQVAMITAGAHFTSGNRYADFNPRTDQATRWAPASDSMLLRILSADTLLLALRSILSTLLVSLFMVLFVYFMDHYHHHRRKSSGFRKIIEIDEHLN